MYVPHRDQTGRDRSPQEPLLILGETDFRRQHQRFGLLPTDRLRHLWVIGQTGSGKSTLLANLIAQDLERGSGLALVDPHGDLVEQVLPLIPSARTNEVLLFAPTDRDHPVSFNVFREGRRMRRDRALLSSSLISAFKKVWANVWGPRLEHVLRNAILAVASDPRATLLFLYRFLTDQALQTSLGGAAEDPIVRHFWTKEFPLYSKALQGEALSPVLNKLGAFVANPIVRNIVGQERSRLDLVDFLDSRGILLANLATGAIGEDASHLLGALLITGIQLSAMERPRGGPPFILYLDEFQHFMTDSLATLLSESRKFGLGLVLAHQYLDQLPLGLKSAVRGNVGSTIAFRLGATDAEELEPEFYPPFERLDLIRLERSHAVVKLLARGETLSPFSARTLPPPSAPADSAERRARILAQSRLRFSQPRAGIEDTIRRALT